MPTECSRNSNCSKSRQRKDKFPYARHTIGGRFFYGHLGEIRSPCAREAQASSHESCESGLRTVAHAVFPHCSSCFLVGDLRNNQVRASQSRAIHETPSSRTTGERFMKHPSPETQVSEFMKHPSPETQVSEFTKHPSPETQVGDSRSTHLRKHR
jgi:hypothetical protein